MMNILVISPFRFAVLQKCRQIRAQMLEDERDDYRVYAIHALPDEVIPKIYGKSFDFAYIDVFYDPEEVAEIRNHITGNIYKNIKFF